MSFKKDLENHFKQFDASPILFVGSGVSKRPNSDNKCDSHGLA